MKGLNELTIESYNKGIKAKDFTSVEITQFFLNYAKEINNKTEAFLEFFDDLAIEQAKEIDRFIEKNGDLFSESILIGVPVSIKDNILIKGQIASAGSKILENYQASYDATVIKKLKKTKSIFLGRTNPDEFAMGSSTENSGFQTTKNPWDLKRVPGGSSGGAAASVAGGQVVWALGSDTGGSIRQPASLCGVVGLKPTYGSVSRYGLIAMASSLDQIGPITKTVKDAEIAFEAIKGKDSFDSTSVDLDKFEKPAKPLKDIVIGLPKEYFIQGLDKEVEESINNVINFFKKQNFKIKQISLPNTKYALACYYIITTAEISANLARFDGIRYGRRFEEKNLLETYVKTRAKYFGDEVKRRIILGTFVLSSGYYDAYYSKAQKVRTLIKQDFDKAFEQVDIILTPTSPTPAFKIGEKTQDPLKMYLSDIFTVPINLAALPALSIPALDLTKDNLPVGFQLIGKPFTEKELFLLGDFYEKETQRFKKHLEILKQKS